MLYDLIIIGGGPAGTAAAVYAARKRLKTLMLVHEWGGQSIVSEQVYNWIGTTALSGNELAQNFKKHVEANIGESLEVKEGEKVVGVQATEPPSSLGGSVAKLFLVKTESGTEYESKTILIATGSNRRKLGVKNADTLEHKGLTYCASCDGPIFADQDVAVIGGGNAGFETAAQLLAYCKSVTLLNRGDVFRADAVTVEKVLKNPKMKAIQNTEILEVKGEKFVQGLIYKDVVSGETKELPVTGIFVEIGQIPNTEFLKGALPLDEIGRVKIDFSNQKTEVPGIWAAGDCTNVLYHQNNIAAGDGVRAIENIYLAIHA